jgi:catechol 2,3-dioxygenase-like lactoylglutathione lyase family enzyme
VFSGYETIGESHLSRFSVFRPQISQSEIRMMQLDKPMLFLATANAERSRAFYERVLGLTFVADEQFALVFHVGPSTLRIQKVDRVQTLPYTALGWVVADIHLTVRGLSEAGVAFERFEGVNQDSEGIWQAPGGTRVAWFRDPDGHVLSLTQFES